MCDAGGISAAQFLILPKFLLIVAEKHPRKEYPDKHRGHDTLGEIRDKNRDKLFNAPSSGAFWKEIKRLADPKPDPIMVTADSLRDVFEKRLNPPAVMPTAFDDIRHKVNQILAAMIPDTTQDTTWIPPMRNFCLQNGLKTMVHGSKTIR
jgi:hypothetical protein